MKDFNTCYVIWKLIFKGEIKLDYTSDNVSIVIQMKNGETNVNKLLLLSIVSKLIVSDMCDTELPFTFNKSDYNDYLKFLKESEVVHKSNLQGDKIYLEEGIDNTSCLDYLMNYVYAMALNYLDCSDNPTKLIDIASKKIVSNEVTILDYGNMPTLISINILYKYLLTAYIESKKFKFASNNAHEIGEFTRSQIDKMVKMFDDGVTYEEIEIELNKLQSLFEKKLEKNHKVFYDNLNGLSIF